MRSSIVCFVLSAFLLGKSAALLEKRQSNGCTCGGGTCIMYCYLCTSDPKIFTWTDNSYSRDDIVNAINEAEDGGAR